MSKVFGADPQVLFDKESGYYYCYATGNTSEYGTFYVYRSKDLIEWEYLNYGLDLQKNNWGKDWFWAPECYFNASNKTFYMFYSARVKDNLSLKYFNEQNYVESTKIGIAVSKTPYGPFENLTDEPMDYFPYDDKYADVEKEYKNPFIEGVPSPKKHKFLKGTYIPTIDANLFCDGEDLYLYFSRCCYKNCLYDYHEKKYIEESNIVAVKLNTNWWNSSKVLMPTIDKKYLSMSKDKRRKDKYTDIITSKSGIQEWENAHIDDFNNKSTKNRRWLEGSTTFTKKINGEKYYFITYSANNYENALYGVGIAYSKKPTSGFVKYKNNPIIHQIPEKNIYSTGHGSIIEKDGKLYYCFHGRTGILEERSLFVCELFIESLDNIYIGEIKECKLKEEAKK